MKIKRVITIVLVVTGGDAGVTDTLFQFAHALPGTRCLPAHGAKPRRVTQGCQPPNFRKSLRKGLER